MKVVTLGGVRESLLTRYSEPITAMQLNLTEIPDDFDFLLSGVIDSFGVLRWSAPSKIELRIQLDLALLDAEDITKIGSLARYIAENANRH